MSDKSKDNLRTVEEYDLELEQMLLGCCDSMQDSDVCDLLQDVKDRVLFAKGYLHDLKPLQTFLYFILKGDRPDIPF